MGRKINDMAKRVMYRLYHKGFTYQEISDLFGVSENTIYGATRLRDRINPETGKPFASFTEYQRYKATQRINPETGKPFASRKDYNSYRANQRKSRKECRKLSELIKLRLDFLDETQSWLAKQVGVSQSDISRYVSRGHIPREEVFQKICVVLQAPYKNLDELVEDSGTD